MISLDPFVERQFEKTIKGSVYIGMAKQDFIQKVNELVATQNYPLKDGFVLFYHQNTLKIIILL